MKKISKLFSLVIFSTSILVPANASAAVCAIASDYDSTKCKIPLCALRPGGFKTSKCHGPLALMAWRAFWGQNPIPIPPSECVCNWIPQVLIPTDQYGIPLSVTKEGNNLQTPFQKSISIETENIVKVAQVTNIDRSSPLIFGGDDDIVSDSPGFPDSALKSSTSEDFFTTCDTRSFEHSGRSSSCYILSGGNRTDINMLHSKYSSGLFSSRHQYDYSIKSQDVNGGGSSSETRMQIRHKTMTYCQKFENGYPVTNANCNVSNLNTYLQTVPDIIDPTTPTSTPSGPIIEPGAGTGQIR